MKYLSVLLLCGIAVGQTCFCGIAVGQTCEWVYVIGSLRSCLYAHGTRVVIWDDPAPVQLAELPDQIPDGTIKAKTAASRESGSSRDSGEVRRLARCPCAPSR